MAETAKIRPGEMRLLDATRYRLPLAALVSILHRLSGLILFLLLPFIVWMFDTSLTSEVSFDVFRTAFVAHLGFVPAWFVKLVALALIWATLHHVIAGLRHVYMDTTHRVDKVFGRRSAAFTLVVSVLLTVLLGAKLFGLY